jgi:peptide/nickel transport system permease protein
MKRRSFLSRFVRRRGPTAAAVLLIGLCLLAVIAPYLPGLDPDGVHLESALAGPSWGHLLGFDNIGRDVVSRLVFSSRVSLVAAATAVVVAIIIGLPLGLLSGYFAGWCDMAVSRVFEGFMSIPPLIFAIVIVSVLHPGLVSAMVAIGIVIAPAFYRVTRAATLNVRTETFIEAARVSRVSTQMILVRHILPNIVSPLLVQIAITMGLAIIVEAALSFIGLGVQLPQASWGSMLRQASSFLGDGPLTFVLSPGVVIIVVVLAFNTLADGLRASIGAEQPGGS